MTESIYIPEEKLQAIHTGFNLINQSISYSTLKEWYQKAYLYNGAITFIALVSALIKVQGAVNQNSDLLLAVCEKIKNETPIDDALVEAVSSTRSIDMNQFVNSLFGVVEN